MASSSCTTQQVVNVTFPTMTLTVTTSGGSASNNTCNAHAKLTYYAGSPAQTSQLRSYTITVDGQSRSGSYSINGITSGTVGEWDFTVNRGTGGVARTISFSVTVAWNITWSGQYVGSTSGSGSVQTTNVPQQFTVSYNANGGSGAPGSQTKYYGQTLILSTQQPTRPGYKFLRWNTNANGTGTSYSPGGQYTNNSAVTLYAIWEVAEVIDFITYSNPIVISANSGKTGADIDSLYDSNNLAVQVSGSSAVANINYYVRIYTFDENTIIQTDGPFTISGATDTYRKISASLMLAAIQSQLSPTQVQFRVAVCTGSNSFSPEMTVSKIATMNISDFSFLRINRLVAYRDKSNGNKSTFNVTYSYAKSYGNLTGTMSGNIVVKDLSGSTIKTYATLPTKSNATYVTSEEGSYITETATFVGTVDSVNDTAKISFTLDDGIKSATATTRMLSIDEDTDIYISDEYCEAVEFIESEDEFGYNKFGHVIAHEFIESNATNLCADGTMEYIELIER